MNHVWQCLSICSSVIDVEALSGQEISSCERGRSTNRKKLLVKINIGGSFRNFEDGKGCRQLHDRRVASYL